jgi:hypothetical protein
MLIIRLLNLPIHLQKLVALLFLALAVCSICLAISLGFRFVASKAESLAEARQRAGRLTQIISFKDLATAVPEGVSGVAGDSLFLIAESNTIGRASLQGRLEAIAQSNGLVLSSAGGLPDLDEGGVKLIGMNIDLSGGHDGLHKAIVDLETSKPPLSLREIRMRQTSGETGDRPVELAAQIKVFVAFRQSGEQAGSVPAAPGTQP